MCAFAANSQSAQLCFSCSQKAKKRKACQRTDFRPTVPSFHTLSSRVRVSWTLFNNFKMHIYKQINNMSCPTLGSIQRIKKKQQKTKMLNKWQKPFGSAFLTQIWRVRKRLGFAFSNWILLCNLFLLILVPMQCKINIYKFVSIIRINLWLRLVCCGFLKIGFEVAYQVEILDQFVIEWIFLECRPRLSIFS